MLASQIISVKELRIHSTSTFSLNVSKIPFRTPISIKKIDLPYLMLAVLHVSSQKRKRRNLGPEDSLISCPFLELRIFLPSWKKIFDLVLMQWPPFLPSLLVLLAWELRDNILKVNDAEIGMWVFLSYCDGIERNTPQMVCVKYINHSTINYFFHIRNYRLIGRKCRI